MNEQSESLVVPHLDMQTVASVILSGGEGTRLHPLTLTRCKPAINFGGRYRIIDIPLSNSIYANCRRIFIITQFLSSSLHHHIFQTYMQGGKAASLIEILTAEQRPSNKTWFEGTADAVRQNIEYLLETPVEYYLILSGDQLYHIDFYEMLLCAKKSNADVTVATLVVDENDIRRMGAIKMDDNGKITDFCEKPQDSSVLKQFRYFPEPPGSAASKEHLYLGSMGIYLFKRQALIDLLKNDVREDFGKHIIPGQVKNGNIAAFRYKGYWKDIGTIESFYEANMNLLDPKPEFILYNDQQPIFSHSTDLFPAKFINGRMSQSILCEGSMIDANEISHSIIGPRSIIQKGTTIRNSYLMGNDYFLKKINQSCHLPASPKIGLNCVIERAIIDKNVLIGDNVMLVNKKKLKHYDGPQVFIRDGIIVVARGATIPDGFVL